MPAYSVAEAKLNHRKCGLLFSMLYPNYTESTGVSSATLISTAPLFKVKFGNLIQDPKTGEAGGSVEDSGLVGAISGFTYSPNIDAGFIDSQGLGTDFIGPSNSYNQGFHGQLYPKEVKLSMEYTVFHTHALGWTGSEKRMPRFPYGEGTAKPQSQASTQQGGFFGDQAETAAQDTTEEVQDSLIEQLQDIMIEQFDAQLEQILDGIFG